MSNYSELVISCDLLLNFLNEQVFTPAKIPVPIEVTQPWETSSKLSFRAFTRRTKPNFSKEQLEEVLDFSARIPALPAENLFDLPLKLALLPESTQQALKTLYPMFLNPLVTAIQHISEENIPHYRIAIHDPWIAAKAMANMVILIKHVAERMQKKRARFSEGDCKFLAIHALYFTNKLFSQTLTLDSLKICLTPTASDKGEVAYEMLQFFAMFISALPRNGLHSLIPEKYMGMHLREHTITYMDKLGLGTNFLEVTTLTLEKLRPAAVAPQTLAIRVNLGSIEAVATPAAPITHAPEFTPLAAALAPENVQPEAVIPSKVEPIVEAPLEIEQPTLAEADHESPLLDTAEVPPPFEPVLAVPEEEPSVHESPVQNIEEEEIPLPLFEQPVVEMTPEEWSEFECQELEALEKELEFMLPTLPVSETEEAEQETQLTPLDETVLGPLDTPAPASFADLFAPAPESAMPVMTTPEEESAYVMSSPTLTAEEEITAPVVAIAEPTIAPTSWDFDAITSAPFPPVVSKDMNAHEIVMNEVIGLVQDLQHHLAKEKDFKMQMDAVNHKIAAGAGKLESKRILLLQNKMCLMWSHLYSEAADVTQKKQADIRKFIPDFEASEIVNIAASLQTMKLGLAAEQFKSDKDLIRKYHDITAKVSAIMTPPATPDMLRKVREQVIILESMRKLDDLAMTLLAERGTFSQDIEFYIAQRKSVESLVVSGELPATQVEELDSTLKGLKKSLSDWKRGISETYSHLTQLFCPLGIAADEVNTLLIAAMGKRLGPQLEINVQKLESHIAKELEEFRKIKTDHERIKAYTEKLEQTIEATHLFLEKDIKEASILFAGVRNSVIATYRGAASHEVKLEAKARWEEMTAANIHALNESAARLRAAFLNAKKEVDLLNLSSEPNTSFKEIIRENEAQLQAGLAQHLAFEEANAARLQHCLNSHDYLSDYISQSA